MELNRLKEIIGNYLSSISQRERRIIFLGLPIAVFVLYTATILIPIIGAKERYEKKREIFIEKVNRLKPKIEEIVELKGEISPILQKVKRGRELDVVPYIRTVSRMVGVQIKRVKLLEGKPQKGIKVDIISLEFKEQPLNRVAKLIFKLETGRYYFKSDSIRFSDYDENGLISGKVTLLFFRGEK